jgi:hypothetical protein
MAISVGSGQNPESPGYQQQQSDDTYPGQNRGPDHRQYAAIDTQFIG